MGKVTFRSRFNAQRMWGSVQELSPAQFLMASYALVILIGTLLLTTPWAAREHHLNVLDALFTATSALCVTGLSVIDIGTRLSGFGQSIVLVLIQLGGLGITTFSVYLFIYLRVGVSIRGRWIINETLLHTPISSWRDLLRDIFLLTFIIEASGAILLAFAFVPKLGLAAGLYSAIFHSISAFCNAGFSLFSDSMIGFRDNPLVNVTLILLIVLGGIGFLVIRELVQYTVTTCRVKKRPPRLSLHTKIVVTTTATLIISGALIIGFLEGQQAFAAMPFGEKVWTSLFQSVTARTAGFNSFDLSLFEVPTLFFITFLMFIGASPGSAGGGVKTTSLALFFAIFLSRLRGRQTTSLFRRTIPDDIINKALALVLLAITLIGIALFALLVVQNQDIAHEDARQFLEYLFETFSAFSTTGLSIGATAALTSPGKIIIVLLMFAGRVGLLTMAFAIAGRSRNYNASYAEENIMIG